MDFRPVNPDLIKYEVRMVKGEDAFAKHQRTPGGFGRFLSSVGKFFGALAMPLSILFPPAMIGALGAYGLGKVGDQIQYKAYSKAAQENAQTQNAVCPGMDDILGSPQGISPVQADILNVLYARNDLMMDTASQMK